MEKVPVYTFPIYRKSTPTKKFSLPLTPITNQQNGSATKAQCSEPKLTKNIQVMPKRTTPLKRSSPAAKATAACSDKLHLSAINLKENVKIADQATAITWNTSRRMTRSQTVLLAQAPVNIRKRKSEPANLPNKNLANQLTSKKRTTRATIVSLTPLETPISSKKSDTTAKAGSLLKDMSESIIPTVKDKTVATAGHRDNIVKVLAIALRADQNQPITSAPTSVLPPITCDTSQRRTRSQTVLLAQAPLNFEKRKSEPTKVRKQRLTNKVTPKEGAKNVVTTSLTSKLDVSEVTPETGTTSTTSKSVDKAEILPKDISAFEVILGEEGDSVPAAGFDENANVSKEHSGPEETEPTVTTLNSQLTVDSTVAAATSLTSSIRPRRSTHSARRVKPKTIEDVTRKDDTLTLPAARPVKTARRRNTVNSVQFSTDENVTNASIDEQETNAAMRLTASFQSHVTKKSASTEPVQGRDKSSSAISRNSTVDENVAITSIGNEGESTEPSTAEAASGDQSNVTNRSTKGARRKSKLTAGLTANSTGTPVSARIKHKESGTTFIKLPDDLRQILMDDSKFINSTKRLYEIPTDVSVAEVIGAYVTIVAESDASNSWNPSPMTSSTLFQGIIEYFDVLIGRQLLYEPERDQFEWISNKFAGEPMSKIYPPIYLLRLLVQMNKLLHFKKTSEDVMKFSMDHLNRFLKYLADNKATYFKTPS